MAVVRDNERTPLLKGSTTVPANAAAATANDDDDAEIANAADQSKQDPDSALNLSKSKVVTILAANWLGVFLGALDTTVVATLVAPISASFESSNQVSWLGTSYLLALATTTPLYGKLSDIIGRRAASLIAIFLFTLGTLLCGLAKSMNMLIAARALAGCGGGGIMTISSIVASDIIPLKKRGLIQGIVNVFYGLGAALGAPLGGLIVAKYDWRLAFLIQVPFLALAWVLVFIFVRYKVAGQTSSNKTALRQIDWLGSISLILCISGFLLSLSFKNNFSLPWSDPKVWSTMTCFVVFLGVFVAVEAYVSPNPVMPLRILSHKSPICIAWSNFIFSANNFTVLYYYPIFFEVVQGKEPREAGAHLVPNAVALSIGSLLGGYLLRRTGKYYYLNLVLAGLPIVGAAMMAGMRQTPSWLDWVNTFPHGIGVGGNVTVVLIALLANVDRSDMAVATGISYLFRYCGQVFGVGLSGGVLQGLLYSELKKRITGPGSEDLINQIRKVSSIIPHLEPDIRQKAIDSYKVSLRWVFILNGGLAVLNLLVSLLIEEHPLPGSFEEEQKIREERRLNSGTSTPIPNGRQQ